jgi:hypothetical protein
MPMLLTPDVRARLLPAERLRPLPVPSRIVSNGEFSPPPQSRALKAYEARLLDGAAAAARRHGQDVSTWLGGATGMAAAFAALNASFGPHFDVAEGEADDPDAAATARTALRHQFVFDDQVHFLKDDADPALFEPLTGLIELTADLLKLPLAGRFTVEHIKFTQFLKDIYLDSDTKVALLSGAPSESLEGWMLTNDQMAAARAAVNAAAGGRRLLTHAVIAPGHPGWLDEIDRVHAEIGPDGWKGYTVGEPFSPSELRWRLDDEKLMYPAYAKLVAAGVRNLCIHKGLLPAEADVLMPGAEAFARVDDVGRAARDWPQLNFVIYHAGYRTIPQPTEAELHRFEATGRIDWVSDLAEIPAKWGVSNVYADIGASFAFTVLTHPRLAAAMIGTLLKGLGPDRVLWGTDSVWYGSPQWQIEALRRLRMPADLAERFGLADLGAADGPVKAGILGLNAAPLYGLNPADYAEGALATANLDTLAADYRARGGTRSNLAYGYANGGSDA